MKRYIWIVVIMVILALVFLTSTRNSKNNEVVKIGVITDLSGSAAGVYGIPLKQGIDLALQEIDPKHTKYEVIFEDYKLESKLALPAYSSLKLKGVKIFIVDGSSGISVLAPEAKKDGNIILNPSSFIPAYKDSNPLTCRIAMTTDTYAPAYTDFIINKLSKKNIALLLPNVEAGVALRDSISEAVTKAGGNVVGIEMYLKDASDFRTEISKIKSIENVDVVIALNYYSSVSAMFQQIKELGLKSQLIADDWTISNSALTSLGLVDGTYFVGYPYSGDSPRTEKEKYVFDRYNKTYSIPPKLEGLMGYDLLNLIDLAIDKTTSSEPASISKYLTTQIKNYPGVSGTFSFNDDCEVQRDSVFRKVENSTVINVN